MLALGVVTARVLVVFAQFGGSFTVKPGLLKFLQIPTSDFTCPKMVIAHTNDQWMIKLCMMSYIIIRTKN